VEAFSGAITITIDQGLYALVMLLALGVCGLVAIALGAAANIWPESRWFARGRQRFARELAPWIGGVPANAAAIAQIDRLATQFAALNGWTLIGTGVGIIVWTLGVATFALLTTGTLASLVANGAFLIFAISFACIALGLILGFGVGTWRARRRLASRPRPSYGDLRRRRPTDYRARIVGVGPYLIAAYTGVMCLLLGMRGPRLTVTIYGVTWAWSAPLVLGALALLALVIPLATTAFVRWVAMSPRALVDDDALAARGADDFRRALTIGIISAYAWQASAWALMGVATITAQNIQVAEGSALTSPQAALLSGMWNVAFLVAGAAYIVGAILMALRGRLGGRVTHWWRPPAPTAPMATYPGGAPHPSMPYLASAPTDAPRP